MEYLLKSFFSDIKPRKVPTYDKYKIAFILDGLEECKFDLDFEKDKDLTDITEQASMDVLLKSLIKGTLLPSARLWIISQPSGVDKIPSQYIQKVTECRETLKRRQQLLKFGSPPDLQHPVISLLIKLTGLLRQANVKYGDEETSGSSETDSCWNTRNKDTIQSLGKLAFEELEKGNLLFTEENLTECGIDIEKTAVFSGLFTRVTREGCGQYQNNFFCFVHLSIQEFLAAFFVFHEFNNKGENLLSKPTSVVADLSASDFYKKAVDKALDSEKGDWDLFLRFLLGLSLETNQSLLKDLLKKTEHNTKTNKETIDYIKGKISEEIQDSDKNLNLFHCLNELNDQSLVKEVKKKMLSEKKAFENFSASEWSALTFVLLMSDVNLDVFDLKKYLKSEKVFLGMLPVVKVSKTSLLSWCKLSEESCTGLTSSVLTSTSSNLIELDLSHNDLLDSGVKLLANGLKSLQCKVESLKLSGCQVTEEGCFALASALDSNPASPLKELDLSYNHPGDSGSKRLTAIAEIQKDNADIVFGPWWRTSVEAGNEEICCRFEV
ncbi:unnamed protein product [Pleuronectes platessa]|uniref:Uncharacterized protein n=1 Tax=Pleuronectes platessa TaxID=8262 RepID=A0A9N7TX19_PLEPL|nr:unnamed protein product [Pleuronectes platessa]